MIDYKLFENVRHADANSQQGKKFGSIFIKMNLPKQESFHIVSTCQIKQSLSKSPILASLFGCTKKL